MFPESLYVWVRARKSRPIEQVWWWDPLDKQGRPKVDWNGFRRAYEDASRKIGDYTWVEDWKRAQKGRSVELHLFGTEIGETKFEMDLSIVPAWQDAGFRGAPSYSVLLRRPDDTWIEVIFGRDESNALMLSSFVRPRDGRTPHWLDKFDLSFHPKGKRAEKSSKFLVVTKSGDRQLKTYSKASTEPPKKIVPVSYGGGDGSSFKQAVIIVAGDEISGVAAEYAYLKKHYPGYRMRSQTQNDRNKNSYDILRFQDADGKERTIFFDITSFFGKLE